ncbi:MAG: TRAP transporter substrate-binding protein [SAR324 cluster bacterium]|nr:TRAP transporter substrate-binding protein [SAR324 cluster bacterium]
MPDKSHGAITADIPAITELGLKGWEVMRLTKLGVFDVAFGVFGYVASEHAVFEGVDLSSAAEDFAASRANVKVYRKVLERQFEKTFKAKMLVVYRYPSQYMWCNKSVSSLADMKGLKIRVYSTTLGDFVEGVGATSVTVAFAEVVPALQKGVVDCGITGTMPAYKAKWHEVATHVLKINVGAGMAFMAISLKTWNRLDGATQRFLIEESAALEERMWAGAKEDDSVGLRCNTGGPCAIGKAGSMKLALPGPADFKARERILKNFVLKRWAKRCGAACTREWNDTIGKRIGIMARP